MNFGDKILIVNRNNRSDKIRNKLMVVMKKQQQQQQIMIVINGK